MAVKVQDDGMGRGVQSAHQLHQLIADQLPEAGLSFPDNLEVAVLRAPAAAPLAQVYEKWEGGGWVEHQLQLLRERHRWEGGGA